MLLKEVAERLKGTRAPDTVARLGGDESLVLMTAVRETADAVAVAERIVKSMAAEFVVQGHTLTVTCSLGVSVFPDNGEDIEALFKNADPGHVQRQGAWAQHHPGIHPGDECSGDGTKP